MKPVIIDNENIFRAMNLVSYGQSLEEISERMDLPKAETKLLMEAAEMMLADWSIPEFDCNPNSRQASGEIEGK